MCQDCVRGNTCKRKWGSGGWAKGAGEAGGSFGWQREPEPTEQRKEDKGSQSTAAGALGQFLSLWLEVSDARDHGCHSQ